MTPRIGSLCTGTGALDMAVEAVTGGRTVWHCEFADAPSKVLEYRFPGVPNHRDLTAVDWGTVEPIEILTAGFPCQDVSAAGRRAGLKHGTRTGIFHGVMVAIRELHPRLVFLENVMGLFTADGDEWPDSVQALHDEWQHRKRVVALIDRKVRKAKRQGTFDGEYRHRKQRERVRASRRERVAVAEFSRERYRLVPRAIATVLGTLAEAGFDTEWCCVRASDIGAPHRRERVFLVARDADSVAWSEGCARGWRPGAVGEPGTVERTVRSDRAPTADASRVAGSGGDGDDVRVGWGADGREPDAGGGAAADADGGTVRQQSVGFAGCSGAGLIGQPHSEAAADAEGAERRGPQPEHLAAGPGGPPEPRECAGATPDTVSGGRDRWARDPFGDAVERIAADGDSAIGWGAYRPAIERWERILGRRAPTPTKPGARGGQRLAPVFPEFMMGLPAGWVTDVPGLSDSEQLQILGNGVVPQQAAAAYSFLLREAEWAT